MAVPRHIAGPFSRHNTGCTPQYASFLDGTVAGRNRGPWTTQLRSQSSAQALVSHDLDDDQNDNTAAVTAIDTTSLTADMSAIQIDVPTDHPSVAASSDTDESSSSSSSVSLPTSDAQDSEELKDYIAWTVPSDNDTTPRVPLEELDAALFDGLKSRPVEGGMWRPEAPMEWAQNFGRRSREMAEHLQKLVKLEPGDEGYFDVSNTKVKGATIVRTVEDARTVLKALYDADPSILHACDTEVMEIDLKTLGPVTNGYVTCVSVYSGPDFDYGLGDGPGTVLWIDNLDDAAGLLQEFKDWFENPKFLKVWHNYGFDRHVMFNEGIDCRGFGGDTMHMARLQDTSRGKMSNGTGYSLEGLSGELLTRRKRPMKEIFGVKRLRKDGSEGSLVDIPPVETMQRDPKFRCEWIFYSCYDAKSTYMIREKLEDMLKTQEWIGDKNLYDYYQMHMRKFGEVLTDMERRGIRVDAKDYLANVEVQARKDRAQHMKTFRQWAAKQIGPDGLALNPASSVQLCTFLFGGAENEKTKELTEEVRTFKVPRDEIPDDAMEAYRQAAKEHQKTAVEQGNDDTDEELEDEFDKMKAAQLKALCKEYGLKVSGKKAELKERLRGHFLAQAQIQKEQGVDGGEDGAPASAAAGGGWLDELEDMSDADLIDVMVSRGMGDQTENATRKQLLKALRDDISFTNELLSASTPRDRNGVLIICEALENARQNGGVLMDEILTEIRAKEAEEPKHVEVTVRSLGMEPLKYTAGGAPSVTADVLRKLAGDPFQDPPQFGTAYKFFGEGDKGRDACEALFSLCAIGSIDTMIANFLTSLQYLADNDSRVHGALNLNTETGRLSSRRPNLQNQPALEKDKYQIRKAFQASPGNNLIVADYGQLELRLLASMTECKSMISAFESGGDFHSRTALDMFDHVKEKVDSGECLLEWDYAQGDPPAPLLKDMFASERRKAKTLNFSIAYGKTAHGLSLDWGVTRDEAEAMLKKWYDARPEVRDWQASTKEFAKQKGVTRTLMGRYRQLPHAKGRNMKLVGHALRASINTPIQGGAADVAMMAMIKINTEERLKRLGWILLMQIHDEVILEGPQETAEEAFEIVIDCMENPWVYGLDQTSVPLLVDGSYENNNWYDAK